MPEDGVEPEEGLEPEAGLELEEGLEPEEGLEWFTRCIGLLEGAGRELVDLNAKLVEGNCVNDPIALVFVL